MLGRVFASTSTHKHGNFDFERLNNEISQVNLETF